MRVWDVAPFIKNKVPYLLFSLWVAFSKKLKNNGDDHGGSNQRNKKVLSLFTAVSPLENVAHSIGAHRAAFHAVKHDYEEA